MYWKGYEHTHVRECGQHMADNQDGRAKIPMR